MLTKRGYVLICPVTRNNFYSLLLCNLRFTPVISFLHKYSYSSSHSIAYNLMGSSKFLWSLLFHLKIQVNFAFSPIYSYLISYKNVSLMASENTKKHFGKIGIPERSTCLSYGFECAFWHIVMYSLKYMYTISIRIFYCFSSFIMYNLEISF